MSIYQFLFGFVLAPLQLVPGVGSADGMSLREVVWSFAGGWQCFLQTGGPAVGCSDGQPTFFLLWAYTALNFFFNTLGLIVTKVRTRLLFLPSRARSLSRILPGRGRLKRQSSAATDSRTD